MDFKAKGWDISSFLNSRILRIVDYLSLANASPTTNEEKFMALMSIERNMLTPEKLNQVFRQEFRESRESAPGRKLLVILDSIDRLVEAMGVENTIDLAKMGLNALKGTNSVALGLLCNEFVSDETLDLVRTTASVFIELKREWKREEIRRMVRVVKLQNERFNPDWVTWYY